jgi:hypothetical protein
LIPPLQTAISRPMGPDRISLSREDWVEACAFDLTRDADLLTAIARKVNENKSLGVKSYVLLDLDSTLYEVGPRTLRILRDGLRELGDQAPQTVRAAFESLQTPDYSLEDTWRKLGLCLQSEELGATRGQLQAHWRKAFFSNDYLHNDVAYPGAVSFTQALHDLGAELIYLTGRDEPAMREGTLQCLERDGFPLGERTHLRMKASRELDDVEHKLAAAMAFARQGAVVASLENEPRNFVALFEAFPDALHVFVDTVCSDKPAAVVKGARLLRRSDS